MVSVVIIGMQMCPFKMKGFGVDKTLLYKQCIGCGLKKSFNSFYKHKEMRSGCLNKCIVCVKSDVVECRKTNLEYVRAYDRKRGKLFLRKQRTSEVTKKYRKQYPKRYIANYLVANAVRSGKIKKSKVC